MSDRHQHEVNRLWNDLVSGAGSRGEYDLPAGDAELLARFHQRATRSQPDSVRQRAWRRTLDAVDPGRGRKETAMDAGATLPPSGSRYAPNGRASPRPWSGPMPDSE
jgi:hypothetical protein